MTTGYYGRRPKTPDSRDYIARPSAPHSGAFVDLSSGFPEQPYDQLQLGACVANGVAGAVDFARVMSGLAPFDRPSRLFIYWNGRVVGGYPADEDSGLQIRDGIQAVAKYGAPPEADWPYDVSKFAVKPPAGAFTAAEDDEATVYGAVKTADIDAVIASGYPVVFGFTVYDSFESGPIAESGVMTVPKKGEQELGGHCVVAVSTAKDGAQIDGGVPGLQYRKCRNSWGHDGTWGLPEQPGYFWMPISVMDTSDADAWQITTVSDPAKPVPPQPAPPSPQPTPTPDPFDTVMATLRKVWAEFDAWLKKHGVL